MGATYRLPVSLGGATLAEHRRVDGSTEAPPGTVAFLLNGCLVCVARGLLTQVEPALPPPEPPVGSVVRCVVQGVSHAVERLDDETPHPSDPWYPRLFGWLSWADVNAEGTPVLLVPDPAAGADTGGRFPDTSDAPRALVGLLKNGGVRLVVVDSHDESASVDLSREVTEALGRTLLAAARAARDAD
jgi:hypothetical protein